MNVYHCWTYTIWKDDVNLKNGNTVLHVWLACREISFTFRNYKQISILFEKIWFALLRSYALILHEKIIHLYDGSVLEQCTLSDSYCLQIWSNLTSAKSVCAQSYGTCRFELGWVVCGYALCRKGIIYKYILIYYSYEGAGTNTQTHGHFLML